MLSSFLLFSCGILAHAAQCFTPNDTEINEHNGVPVGWLYQPCNNFTTSSMCCAIGPGRGDSKDHCQPNGLCRNKDTDGNALWWRESCTDQTWQDFNCMKLFMNGTGLPGTKVWPNLSYINDVQVTPCSDNKTYCHGSQNYECCNQHEGVYIINGVQYKNGHKDTGRRTDLSQGGKIAISVSVAVSIAVAVILLIFNCKVRLTHKLRSYVTASEQAQQLKPALQALPESHIHNQVSLDLRSVLEPPFELPDLVRTWN